MAAAEIVTKTDAALREALRKAPMQGTVQKAMSAFAEKTKQPGERVVFVPLGVVLAVMCVTDMAGLIGGLLILAPVLLPTVRRLRGGEGAGGVATEGLLLFLTLFGIATTLEGLRPNNTGGLFPLYHQLKLILFSALQPHLDLALPFLLAKISGSSPSHAALIRPSHAAPIDDTQATLSDDTQDGLYA